MKIQGSDYPFKCGSCGRFIKYSELLTGGGGSWCFVPMSDVTHEENRVRCKRCTDKYGAPIPYQNVVVELCSGIY